ncbi:ATPase [Devosia limi DSM 17137]|uniref:ATPase n=1 Tax=Devosia limi DSM 17137 TaxID=1121477 RepID=A0A0F5L4F6_9HYPH|nr:AAA family ATPase [Devosia limi]KKB77296.1 ATPase [Devosia limi DSM 17137]SHE65152.1 Predicted ATPase [Devosia limi DSM 17137]
MSHDRLFIVTGGPGSGKTTLLAAAAASGLSVGQEAGRAIIQSQLAIGGPALPWADQALYSELMLDRDIQTHAAASASGAVTLCDRGVPDIIGYRRLCSLPTAAHVAKAAELYRYNAAVFFAPPWREIYVNDAERKQDWDEAVRTFETLRDVYAELGYRIVELPKAPLAERLGFVMDVIANA